jgi:lipoate-protein ligase B
MFRPTGNTADPKARPGDGATIQQETPYDLLEIADWGQMPYETALTRQKAMVDERVDGTAPDRLILVEHPPVVTLGRSADRGDLCISENNYRKKGIPIADVNRGGKATYHGPGQLVAYPILKMKQRDLHLFVRQLLTVVSTVLDDYGLAPELKNGNPGIWVDSAKIASIGMAVRKWVTYHGVSLNVNMDLTPFQWIVPCGHPNARITSIKQLLGRSVDMETVKKRFVEAFVDIFEYNKY